MSDVQVYAAGICMCSVCAPADMDPDTILSEVPPSGTEFGWMISADPFKTGEANPSPCNTDPSRRHWLLEC